MSNIPSILHTSMNCQQTIAAVENSKALNEIMDRLSAEVTLGAEYTGYIKARITKESVEAIWPLYEQLYDAIRDVKYEFTGGLIDVLDIQLARNDKKFQRFMSSVTKANKKLKG